MKPFKKKINSRLRKENILSKIPSTILGYMFLLFFLIGNSGCDVHSLIMDARKKHSQKKYVKEYNEHVSHVRKLTAQADKDITAKRYDKATEKYTEAIEYFTFKGGTAHHANKRSEHDALLNKLYNLRGWSHYFAGSEKLALRDFFKVSDALPEAAMAAAKISYAMYAEKKPSSSHSTMQIAFRKAIKHYPNKKELYYEKAATTYNLYYNKSSRGIGNKRKAMLTSAFNEVSKALRLDPNYQKAYKLRALLGLVAEGYIMQIKGDADKAIKLNTEDADAVFVRGYVAKKLGNRENAVRYAKKAIAMEPSNQKYRNAHTEWQKKEVKSLTKDDWIAAFLGIMLLSAMSDDGQVSGNQNKPNTSGYDYKGPGSLYQESLNALQDVGN